MNLEQLPIYISQETESGTSLEDLCQKLVNGGYNANFITQCIHQWLETKLQTPQPEEVKPEVNPKDISHAIFRATHERGWFHEKDALDILSKYTITAK